MDVSHCESAVHNVCVIQSEDKIYLSRRKICERESLWESAVHSVCVCVCFSLRTRSTREVHSVSVFQSKDKIYL